jgi:hypothetical protein
MLLGLHAHGQGTVYFSNLGLGAYVIMDTPVTVGTTTYAIGSKAPPGTIFSIALYWSPYDPANPTRPDTPFSQVGPTGHLAIPGIYNVGIVTIPGITPPGGPAWFQVKGWDAGCGSTYEEALNHDGVISGTSSIFFLRTTGDPTIGGNPASLGIGNGGFGLIDGVGPGNPGLCVPEPSAVSMAFVAAAVLLLARARTRRRHPGRP